MRKWSDMECWVRWIYDATLEAFIPQHHGDSPGVGGHQYEQQRLQTVPSSLPVTESPSNPIPLVTSPHSHAKLQPSPFQSKTAPLEIFHLTPHLPPSFPPHKAHSFGWQLISQPQLSDKSASASLLPNFRRETRQLLPSKDRGGLKPPY